jgi:hypothetical protein
LQKTVAIIGYKSTWRGLSFALEIGRAPARFPQFGIFDRIAIEGRAPHVWQHRERTDVRSKQKATTMSNDKLDSEMAMMVAEAQAARDKYGEVLSSEEEFLLEAECEAIAKMAMSEPVVFEYARLLVAAKVLEEFEDKEEWSD